MRVPRSDLPPGGKSLKISLVARHLIHDPHHHRPNRQLRPPRICRAPLPSSSTRTVSPRPGADRVDGDDVAAGRLAVGVELVDDQQLRPGIGGWWMVETMRPATRPRIIAGPVELHARPRSRPRRGPPARSWARASTPPPGSPPSRSSRRGRPCACRPHRRRAGPSVPVRVQRLHPEQRHARHPLGDHGGHERADHLAECTSASPLRISAPSGSAPTAVARSEVPSAFNTPQRGRPAAAASAAPAQTAPPATAISRRSPAPPAPRSAAVQERQAAAAQVVGQAQLGQPRRAPPSGPRRPRAAASPRRRGLQHPQRLGAAARRAAPPAPRRRSGWGSGRKTVVRDIACPAPARQASSTLATVPPTGPGSGRDARCRTSAARWGRRLSMRSTAGCPAPRCRTRAGPGPSDCHHTIRK